MAGESKVSGVKAKVAPIRRIITGHDEQGRAIVVSDGICPHADPILGQEYLATTEMWITPVPADNDAPGDPVTLPHRVPPPENGAVFRVVEFPPDKSFRHALRSDQRLVNDGHHKGPNQMLHRTRSVDFVVVMSGEIWCVMDEGEVLMRAGDVMVQRGTNHDWQNRGDQPARVAFTLIDAMPLREANYKAL
jgi:mannose-6-phosphate isomerase-like protein (cupin superfamily)